MRVAKRSPIRALLSPLLFVTVANGIGCSLPAEGEDMTIEVRLQVANTDLLFQENPPAELTVTNRGREAVNVQSIHNSAVPTFRVVELQTGAESLHKGDPGMTGIETEPLEAGESVQKTFPLLETVRVPRPGGYEITALVEHSEGTLPVESAPLRLNFRPAAPKGIALVSVAGGAGGLLYGATVNSRSDPPEIVRYALAKSGHDGVVDAKSVGPAARAGQPMLSSPRNRVVEHSHFVAWLAGNSFTQTYVDMEGKAQPASALALDGTDAQIVQVSIAPYDAAHPEPAGEALLVQRAEKGGSYFSVIRLTPGASNAGAFAATTGGHPLWATSVEKSEGQRAILFCHEGLFVDKKTRGLVLREQVWPGEEPSAGDVGRVLAEWEDVALVGSAVTLTFDDETFGASLVRSTKLDEPKLEMRTWSLSKDGAFSELASTTLPWGDATPINTTRIAVGPKGAVAALIRDGEKQWFVFDAAGLREVTGRLAKIDLTFSIAYFASDPLLVVASEAGGMQLLQLSGEPLKPSAG